MKWSFLMIVLAPLCLGCLEIDVKVREMPRHATPVSAITTPVVADQVNNDNARRMAQALWDEMDRDEQAPASLPAKGR